MLRSGDHLAPLPTKTNSPTATTRRRGNNWQPPPQESHCCNAAATRHRIAAMGIAAIPAHCNNARIVAMPQRIAAMPVLLQCLSVLPQYLFQCSYCRNIAAMLMLLAMPFSIAAICIAAILKRIAAMLPLLHHCGNAAIARGIAAMLFWHCRNTPIFSICTSERAFSQAGLVISKKRQRLMADHVDSISLLGWHYKDNGWGESAKRSRCVPHVEGQRLEEESKMAAP